ncbi:hypothetical protein CDAR_233081 [Caerostris darwini]|uniref:Secreted protein n=1 Tax=Caerostris darwini TaxID=1538125 RepID=A0AAV4Q7I0_9ARAC|nr:hypothetical protein CDAR_233081 [Caerostris darwini]
MFLLECLNGVTSFVFLQPVLLGFAIHRDAGYVVHAGWCLTDFLLHISEMDWAHQSLNHLFMRHLLRHHGGMCGNTYCGLQLLRHLSLRHLVFSRTSDNRHCRLYCSVQRLFGILL